MSGKGFIIVQPFISLRGSTDGRRIHSIGFTIGSLHREASLRPLQSYKFTVDLFKTELLSLVEGLPLVNFLVYSTWIYYALNTAIT